MVLEPVVYEQPQNNFLNKVRQLTNQNDSVLVLDEIVTGFRFDLGGAQKYFNIKGDLVCFGKGMGNGLPISSITGPSEFMKSFNEVWVSSTNNSENLSLAGTYAVIKEMQEKKTISHCWNIGKKLFDGWNQTVKKFNLDAKMYGYPIRMHLQCFDSDKNESLSLKSLLLQEMVKNGIFMSVLGSTFICYSHSEKDVENTLISLENACEFVTKNVKNENYEEFLEGDMPKSIWSIKIEPTKKRT